MFGQGLYVPKDPLWTKQMGTQIMSGALHSRSDNGKLLVWKQDLYRAHMVIEQNEEDAWVRGGIPMSLVYFRTYLLYNYQIAPRPPQAPRKPIAEET